MAIRAVLFDLDNTLTHRDESIRAYSQYLAQHYSKQLAEINLGKIKTIINRIDNGGYPQKELLTHPSIGASVAYALQQELNWISSPNFDHLTQFWFQYFGQYAVAMAGAEALLQLLKQQQYKLAVVSNGGHTTRLNILQGLGFATYFDEIISSESAGIAKPHTEIFHYASRQLNVASEECLFIGDHPINDIYGAMQAGMQALWLEGFHPVIDGDVPINKIQTLNQVWQYLV